MQIIQIIILNTESYMVANKSVSNIQVYAFFEGVIIDYSEWGCVNCFILPNYTFALQQFVVVMSGVLVTVDILSSTAT